MTLTSRLVVCCVETRNSSKGATYGPAIDSIVVCDEGDNPVERAAEELDRVGYNDDAEHVRQNSKIVFRERLTVPYVYWDIVDN